MSNRTVVGGPYVLKQSGVQVTHTGDTNETEKATATIPANALGANGSIRVSAVISRAGGTANTITFRIRYTTSAGTVYAFLQLSTTQESGRGTWDIFNRNATNSQVGGPTSGTGGVGVSTSAEPTSAVDTTAETTISFTLQCANAGDTAGLEAYRVELFYGA